MTTAYSKINWIRATRSAPCQICQTGDERCQVSPDGRFANCWRHDDGRGREKTDSTGSTYWTYRLDGSASGGTDARQPFNVVPGPARADDTTLDRVYAALLSHPLTRLSEANARQLVERGFTAWARETFQYRSHPGRDRRRVAQSVVDSVGEKVALSAPGLYNRKAEGGWALSVAGQAGLLIPVRNVAGQVVAISNRLDDASEGTRYRWLSSKGEDKGNGPGPGSPIHIPLGTPIPSPVIRITEGALKADLTWFLSSEPTIGLAGIGNCRLVPPTLKALGATTARVACDADWRTNFKVAKAFLNLVDTLKRANLVVEVETWDANHGKGIDDVLANGFATELHAGIEVDSVLRQAQAVVDANRSHLDGVSIAPEPEPTVSEADAILGLIKAIDDPDKFYSDPVLMLRVAKIAQSDPGRFKMIKDTFKAKATADKRFNVADLDASVRQLRTVAKKTLSAEAKAERSRQKRAADTRVGPRLAEVPDETHGQPEGDEQRRAVAESQSFANYHLEETEDDEGNTVLRPVAHMMHTIDDDLMSITQGWPKRVGHTLFHPTEDLQPSYLNSPARLFAWVGRHAQVNWTKGTSFITQEQFYEDRRMKAEAFESIEVVPHTPPRPDAYYMHQALPKSSGKLDQLVDYFSAATPVDRELIKAYITTPSWGGPPGKRPAFLFTGTDDDKEHGGRGLGKSTAMFLPGQELYGGGVNVSPNDEMGKVNTRLLSASAILKRIICLDNVKTLRFSWGELEGLITSPIISGHALYEGEGQRPNNLTVAITLNGASLSKDLAERVIVIKLARPKAYMATWEEDVRAFARENRWEILSEIADLLAADCGPFKPRTRWAAWEANVLSKMSNPTDCQDSIVERQGAIDDDDAGRGMVVEYFRQKITESGRNPDTDMVRFSSQVAAAWLSEATRDNYKAVAATNHLKRLCIDQLFQFRTGPVRGWRWKGKEFGGTDDDEHEIKPGNPSAPKGSRGPY